jgi:tetratricopeptide (TPR) repeat protein
MKKRTVPLLILLLATLTSCLTFKYDHIMERFMEYDDFDFNRIKEINIVTENRDFADALSSYIRTLYRNRGLFKPTIKSGERRGDGLSHQMEIVVKNFDFEIVEGWKNYPRDMTRNADGSMVVFHNNVRYWKTIAGTIHLQLYRFAEQETVFDVTGDFSFTIEEETAAIRTHRESDLSQGSVFGIPTAEDLARNGLRLIDETRLHNGVVDQVMHEFLSKRLQLISREMVRFQVGFSRPFLKATEYLRQDRLDEALIIWEELYADPENPSYARGVAAYNIAMIKTMEREYEKAAIYFNRSEELKEEGMQEIVKY